MFKNKPAINNANSVLKHKDISAVVFMPEVRTNIYLRTPAYRKRKSIKIVGTNSECY